MIEELMDFD